MEIKDREKTEAGGQKLEVFCLETMDKRTTIRVPVKNSEAIGLRHLYPQEEIETVWDILRSPSEQDELAWYERCRINEARIKTGQLEEIAKVVRDLIILKDLPQKNNKEVAIQKEADKLLVNELAYVEKHRKNDIRNKLKAIAKQRHRDD